MYFVAIPLGMILWKPEACTNGYTEAYFVILLGEAFFIGLFGFILWFLFVFWVFPIVEWWKHGTNPFFNDNYLFRKETPLTREWDEAYLLQKPKDCGSVQACALEKKVGNPQMDVLGHD